MPGGFSFLQPLQTAFTTLLNYLPQIIGALVVLVIGYIVARVLRSIITKLLRKAKLDDKLTDGKGGEYVARFSPQGSPAALVGTVVYAVIMLFVVIAAVGTLGIPTLTNFMNLALSYLPNVIAALLIFLVAAGIAAAVGGLVHRVMGDTPTGRIAKTAGPTLVMAIAVFMILNQLGIAAFIVNTTFVALIGSVALGSALAFGLGGRDAAADLINSGYRKAQEQAGTVRDDLAVGRERATTEARAYRSGNGHEVHEESAPTGPTPTEPAAVAANGHAERS